MMSPSRFETLVVVQNMPPVICGVGDYTTRMLNAYMARSREVARVQVLAFGRETRRHTEEATRMMPDAVRLTTGSVWRAAIFVVGNAWAGRFGHLCVQYTSFGFGPNPALVIAALLVLLLPRQVLSVTLHTGLYAATGYVPFRRRLLYWLLGWQEKALLRCARTIITTSVLKYQRAQQLAGQKSRVKLMYVPSNVGFYPVSQEEALCWRAKLLDKWADSPDCAGPVLVVGLFGRGVDRQCAVLLRMLGAPVAGALRAAIVCIGPSALTSANGRFQEAPPVSGSGVILRRLGVLHGRALSLALQGLDALVFLRSGWRLTTSGTAAAAFQHGVPIVVQDSETIPVEMRKLVVCVKDIDSDTMSLLAGSSLVRDPVLRRRLQRYYREKYSWQDIAQVTFTSNP